MHTLLRFRRRSRSPLPVPVSRRLAQLLGALLALVLVAIIGSTLPTSTHSAPLTQASPPTANWVDGDVFVALDNGRYAQYSSSGALIEIFDDGTGTGGRTAGC